MLEWSSCLIPSKYVHPENPPDDTFQATAPEGGTIYALVWGDGRAGGLYNLQVIHEPLPAPEGSDQPDSRLPYIEEILSFADAILPPGVILGFAPFPSLPPGERPTTTGPAPALLSQVGALPGSPAAHRQLLHSPHGIGVLGHA